MPQLTHWLNLQQLVLPGGEPAEIKIEERWLLPAVLELIPEEYDVNQVTMMIVERDDWRKPFIDYFNHGTWPDDSVERRRLQQRLPSYIYKVGILY